MKSRLSRLIIMDGAMGTMLLPHVAADVCLEGLNLERPRLIEEVHRSYIDAGAAVLLANTFGANRPRLSRYRMGGRLEGLNRAGVKIARKAAEKKPVYASIGPLGPGARKMTSAQMRAFFQEQAKALEKERPDGFVIETMSSLTEAEAAVAAVRSVSRRKVITLMTNSPRSTPLSAEAAEIIAVTLHSAGADIVGANCGVGPEDAYAAIKSFSQAGQGPFAVRMAGGLPGRILSPDDFADWGTRFAKLGCRWIGGCCGTTPAHIRTLKDAIEGL